MREFLPFAELLPAWLCVRVLTSGPAGQEEGGCVLEAHCCREVLGCAAAVWLPESPAAGRAFLMSHPGGRGRRNQGGVSLQGDILQKHEVALGPVQQVEVKW